MSIRALSPIIYSKYTMLILSQYTSTPNVYQSTVVVWIWCSVLKPIKFYSAKCVKMSAGPILMEPVKYKWSTPSVRHLNVNYISTRNSHTYLNQTNNKQLADGVKQNHNMKQSQRAHDAITTSLWHQNDVATSLWRHNDVIIVSCTRWG